MRYLTRRVAETDDHYGPEVFGNTAKIWTAYNIEATKEDQALSRNIREDMNTILVFVSCTQSKSAFMLHPIIPINLIL